MGRTAGAANKKRKAQDPNKPKRPTSAYFYYVASERARLEKAGTKVTKVAEFTKEVSERWRNLQEKDKKQFNDKAAVDKERYDTEMCAYSGKDANKPKRPLSSYFLWLAEFREKNKTKYSENKELLRAAGETWKSLSETEKAPWEKKAAELKKQHLEDMKEYNKSKPEGGAAKKPKMYVKNGNDDDDEEEDEEEDDEDEDDSDE